MVEFQKLVFQNFLSFGEKQEVFLNNQGVVRIEGQNLDESSGDSNRAGKSAIIEALLWCLFGRTVRGIKHDGVVNRFEKRDCFVSTYFRVKDSSYHVRRYRRHRKHGNHLRLWIGNELISFRHEEETQKKLEAILDCDFTAFSNSVIFGGIRPFALLPDSEQKKVLESFLRFEQFDRALKRARELISEAEEKRQALAIETERQRVEVKSLREQIGVLKRSESVFLDRAGERYSKARRQLRKFPKPRISEKEVQEFERTSRADLESLVSRRAAADEKVRLLERQLKNAKTSLRDRELLINKPCPVCGRKVTAGGIQASLEHLRAERLGVSRERDETLKLVSRLKRREEHARARLMRVQKLHQNVLVQDGKLRKLEEREREALESLHATRFSSSPLTEEIALASIKYSKTVSKMLVVEQEARMMDKRLNDLHFWETGFGNTGIKALIVREALPALNSKLTEYSDSIFGRAVELEFVPTKSKKSGGERELFNIYYAAKRGAGSYLGESGGGRRRVDICILLCFAWLSRTSNLLLVDELLDSLDDSGRESVLGILSRIRGTVLVVSHRRELKARVGKVLTVVKKDGFSRILRAA